MVPKLARPEFEAPVARITRRVEDAIEGMRSYGAAPLWGEAVNATLSTVRATSHLLRAQLVLLGSLAGGGTSEGDGIERFAAGVELLHLFMLVHDDVMDNAQLRRGRPALRVALSSAAPHLEWQQARDLSIVVGNVINVLATRHILPGPGAPPGEVAAAELVLDGCCHAGAGQFQDLLGFQGLGDDEDALRRELVDKTAFHAFAAPFAAGVRLASSSSVAAAAALAWGRRVGLAFQATDDLADLVSSPAVTGKDSLRDLLEGRPSLPLYFLRRRATGDARDLVDATIGRHTIEYGVRARIDDLLRELGVIGACISFARAELSEAAKLTETSGFTPQAREGMAAIERGLHAYLDVITANASQEIE
ncbi:Octaprenyl diphosphate synthase [Minicystis rosea]|nr:Octaprenyl diphosphate synthase [Minicystis rosea]